MATEERLPPACAFAISVLAEYDQDPEAVPEEAVEAAQQHIASCERCVAAFATPAVATSTAQSTSRKKKKARRASEVDQSRHTTALLAERVPSEPARPGADAEKTFDCAQCRPLLLQYAEAQDSKLDVATLYPEVHAHLQSCDAGCQVLLALCQQEAKATRKNRRRPVRNPFKVIGWELTGFFRGGQVPISPRALAFGTLLLLIVFASLSTYTGIYLYEARYHPAPIMTLPDGIGISDGLHTYDACNTGSFNDKRQAAQALQSADLVKADSLLKSALSAPLTDSTGCNGAEAAIYREDLHVRQAKRPFSIVLVAFDSGPGDPQSSIDRRMLYAASTQELVGAFIAQQQYNEAQMKLAQAPLLYLVLANTTGVEQGALQITNTIAALAQASDLHSFGLLAQGAHPFSGVLGMGSTSLAQTVLPTLCRVGVPLIAPGAMGTAVTDQLQQTTLYNSCAPGFAFIRPSADDAQQVGLGANYAYHALKARNIAIFYDSSNQAAIASAQSFRDNFLTYRPVKLVAQEAIADGGVLDASGHPQAARDDLLAELNDALQARPRPDMLYLSLPTDDVTTLVQAIAHLPQGQQPAIMVGGEFVQPRLLRDLVQWARQQQLTLPRIVALQATASRPPSDNTWQKQFYASFCTSFATAGSYCSGAATLDQGALFFADGISMITRGISASSSGTPTRAALVQKLQSEAFTGVSGPVTLQVHDHAVLNSAATPVVVSIQQDGTLQIVI